ncbi:uncharacterized protein LOC142365304 isoform X2 [Opisthocomus hoazin]|uniref:uncharacterized protein LOC142365304 isoform X2 n=1 Tax=Opisthocomus hoazin TaxID=30419 RepID=UPI003F530C12
MKESSLFGVILPTPPPPRNLKATEGTEACVLWLMVWSAALDPFARPRLPCDAFHHQGFWFPDSRVAFPVKRSRNPESKKIFLSTVASKMKVRGFGW